MRRSARYLAAVLLATYILYGAAPARAALGDCGQPVSTGITVTASDALRILLTAVGSGTCTPVCICDVNAVGGVTATDALLVLQRAVGQNIVFACPCANISTTSTSTGFRRPVSAFFTSSVSS